MNATLARRTDLPSARIERVLVEAIESVATPSVAVRLLRAAVAAADRATIPCEREELEAFVEGSLYEVLAGMLGEDEAAIVVQGLAPILPRVSDPSEQSQVRMSVPAPVRSAEFERATVAVDEDPLGVVIIVSAHPQRRKMLVMDLGRDCVALQADDLMALYDHVDAAAFASPVLLLDCRDPSVNPISVATLVPDLPQGSSVVLWGATEAMEAEVTALAQGRGRFVRSHEGTTAADVAALVRTLLSH